MLPFTPRRKDNLAAWLVARSDAGALRRRPRLPVPETEGGLRAAAGRRAHQPGPDDLAADHAVESAGIAGDLGHADGDSDRGVAHLRPTALPARRRRPHSRAHAWSSSYSGSDRDGTDARRRRWRDSLAARPAHAPSRTPAATAANQQPGATSTSGGSALGRSITTAVRRSPTKRRRTISAPSTRSVRVTGRSMAKKSRRSGKPSTG